MHFTDSCQFLISSAFKFTALCTILLEWTLEGGGGWTLKPLMYSVGDVPGSIPGADLSETWTTPLKAVYGQNSNPDLNSGQTDYQATTEALSQAFLFGAHEHKITNGGVIYIALYVMILMWENPLLGPL